MTADRTITVTHTLGERIVVASGGVELLTYVYAPDPHPSEVRKPYIHPLRTLAGSLVSGYRPSGHRWHKSMQVTAGLVSGENFCGANPCQEPEGGPWAEERTGSVRHDGFSRFVAAEDRLRFVERLTWLGSGGQERAAERRTIELHSVDPTEGAWVLDWSLHLINVRDEPLRFGSATTADGELGGCTGLNWRGPRDFVGGDVLGPGALGGEGQAGAAQLMGVPASEAPWIAFTAEHDETDARSTLLFNHAPEIEGAVHSSHWYVSCEPIPSVALSWAFFDAFQLPPGESFGYRYRFVVADGAWDRDRAEAYFDSHQW
ncbi:PmoA family protein [Streptomyces sp. NPDC052179]|uniref:DUF6807 domain-containing protein n=1 Tax=Streptomyces sp. NPDC052179 TaxID=3155680 RepID=UPI0034192EF8